MNVSVDGAFVYFVIPVLGGIPITQTTVSFFLVTVILVVASILLGKNLQKRPTGVQVLVEKGVNMIYDLTISAMGAHNANWAPYMGSIFLCSICGSYIGLTGFLRSATADLSCPLVWAVMCSVIIWHNSIKANGVRGWLKGYTEPVVVMTPMNLISEVAQPISMAFRHFGNVAGGGVISSIIYTAFTMLSTLVIGSVSSCGWLMCLVMMGLGAALWLYARKKKKLLFKLLAIVVFVFGFFGLLSTLGVLENVPVLALGIPAVLSVYFDFFSGFVQALVFTLLSMVYIAGSIPETEAAE